ncbi:6917_t:CDS:2 [Funneliformis geosporum]|uniref:6917_t:CDS:1 n=1 Tax=Funneliformis geosporum TaxID=1117311 RepID=A0A9W4STY5_9GLOM|nr:6917_t:CDS:2 [Funneliformis geosporum]
MSTFTILGKSFTLWCFDQKSKVIFKVIIVDIEYNKIKNITLDGLLIDKLENEIDTIGRVFDEELAMLEFWKGLSKAKIIFPYSQNMLLDNSLFEVKNESDLEFNLRPTVKDGLMDNKYVYLKDVVNMQIDDLLEQFNCDGFLCLSNKFTALDKIQKFLDWDKDIYLYFVVPPEIFYRFPPQKYKNSKNDDHQKFPTWINKLSQYALEVPMRI